MINILHYHLKKDWLGYVALLVCMAYLFYHIKLELQILDHIPAYMFYLERQF